MEHSSGPFQKHSCVSPLLLVTAYQLNRGRFNQQSELPIFATLRGFGTPSSVRFLVHFSCFCGLRLSNAVSVVLVVLVVALIMQNSAAPRWIHVSYTHVPCGRGLTGNGHGHGQSPRHCTECNLWLQIMKRKGLHVPMNVSRKLLAPLLHSLASCRKDIKNVCIANA